jgi:hypothetical protein
LKPTLRDAIRVLSEASPKATKKLRDPETTKKVIAALGVIWKALKKAWPRFREWFRQGLNDDEWARYQELGNKLPSVTPEQRQELLDLTRRGLRLNEQSSAETEGGLPDAELDAPVDDPDPDGRS